MKFKINENVKLKVFDYDDQGHEYTKIINGRVHQITNNFVVIDNGYYKEAFLYSQFVKCTPGNVEEGSYDLSLESYTADIIKRCIELFSKGKEGIVFNSEQLNEVINNIITNNVNSKYTIRTEEGIYYIKKI